jgi:plasmid stability protein
MNKIIPSSPDPLRSIIIRNVPESVRRELKARAAKEGKTMQGVLLELIEKYVGKRNDG